MNGRRRPWRLGKSKNATKLERALDLVFGANRPTSTSGEAFRREVREAFRRRALETHPDRAQALGRSEASLAEEFRRILEAYEFLSREEAPPAPRPVAQRPRDQASRPPRDHLSHAPLPHRPLLFAEFLYYSGRASWRNLVEAVSWQRRQRPSIGRIAVEWGHLSDEEVREILDRRRRDRVEEPFGEYARRQGFLSGGPAPRAARAAAAAPAPHRTVLRGDRDRRRAGDPLARRRPLPPQRALAPERLRQTRRGTPPPVGERQAYNRVLPRSPRRHDHGDQGRVVPVQHRARRAEEAEAGEEGQAPGRSPTTCPRRTARRCTPSRTSRPARAPRGSRRARLQPPEDRREVPADPGQVRSGAAQAGAAPHQRWKS